MAERSSRTTRLGLLAAGLLLGGVLALIGLRVFVREAEEVRVEAALRERLRLPEEAFELEEILPDHSIRALLRDVAILDEAGDTIVAAPRVGFVFDAASVEGTGPLVFRDVVVEDPLLRLVQTPAGEWNLAQAFTLEAGGEAVGGEEAEGRGFVLRGVRVTGGRLLLATPWSPEDSLLAGPEPRLVRLAGTTMLVRTARDLDARLPVVRFGGERGWRVEVAEASAFLAEPQVGRVALSGWAEEAGEGFRFALDALRTGRSFLEGRGTVRLAGDVPQVDATFRAAPLSFADLQWIRPDLPAEGTARFVLDVDSRPGGRTAWAFSDADVRVLDSRAFGRLTVVTAEDAPPVFLDTRLTLDPLVLSDLEALGFVEDLPYTGQVTGTLASTEAIQGAEGSLRIDLAATLLPEGVEGVPASTLAARGLVAFGEDGLRFREVRVEADPFYVAALAPFVETGRERLRGVIRGSALVSGTPRDLRIGSGLLSYEVGDAPPTRLRVAEARVTLDPELSYRIEAAAEPLALATLTELFPALPFQAATLSGPITLSGTRESVRFDADLSGAAGGIAFRGSATLGEPLRFDVTGEVEAFRTGRVLAGETPLEGPLTGSFAVRGTPADLRFNVDLAQAGGRFALEGRLREAGGLPRQFEVAGQVTDFRIGTLIGRPGLLPSPVSGRVALTGGGRQPYRFDVDLRGGIGVLDLEGWYAPGPVPEYAASGTVAGLNLKDLPQMGLLPETSLTGTLSLRGRGTTLETLSGSLSFRSTGPSTVGGLPVETAVADLAVRDGVLVVDAFRVALGGAALTAEGTLGLTRPAPGVLRYSLVARDLGTLAAVVPPPGPLEPPMAGSIALSGWVSGTVQSPRLAATVRADGLRFQEWRAASLAGSVQLALVGGEWTGEGSLDGRGLGFPGGESLQALRLEVNATPGAASFGLFARRNEQADVAASGSLELEGRELRGALLEALTLRISGTTWQLAAPSRLRWGGVEGVAIDSLVLRRSGEATGLIAIDGRLPPTGQADLRIQAEGVDLAELRRIAGRGPEVAGVVTLDAVVQGPVEEPGLILRASVDSLVYEGARADRVTLNGRHVDRRFLLDAGVWTGGMQVLTAEAGIPMIFSWTEPVPRVELLEQGALTARVVADSVPMGLVTASLPGVREGEGVVRARVDVAGTIRDPVVRGWAGVSGGAVTIDTLGTRWEEIRGRVSMEGDLIRIDSLVARSQGWARLEGTVRLVDIRSPEVYLTTTLSEFRAVDKRDVANVLVSGRLALSGRLPSPTLSGRLVLDEGTIYIPEITDERVEMELVDTEIGEIGADTVPEGVTPTAGALLGGVRVSDLEVVVEDDIWLESPDARVQIAGELLIDQQDETPQVYGELRAIRGVYTLRIGQVFRREFEIERGRVEFFGTPELNPALDIVAVHEVRAATPQGGPSSVLRILVNITGTMEQPRISLTSDTRPPLPEDELLNYLVFGRPSFALGQQTGQLAQQLLLESFLAGYVASELEQTLARTGLVDFVRVRTGQVAGLPGGGLGLGAFEGVLGLGAATVEFGWEVAEGLFVTLEVASFLTGDMTLGVGAEWVIDPHWSVRAAWEVPRQDVGAAMLNRILRRDELERQWAADVFWRREFGHPEEEAPPVLPAQAQPLPGQVVPPPPPAPDAQGERPPPAAPPEEEPQGEEDPGGP